MAAPINDSGQDPYEGMVATGLEGGITSRILAHGDRAFVFEVTFDLAHPRMVALAGQRPPEHFHPYQDEYVEVTRGRLVVEVEGREHVLTPATGEFVIPRWANHRLYPPPPPSPAAAGTATGGGDGGDEDGKETRFLLSGEDTPRVFRLDAVFFENWYAYQDEVLLRGKSIDVLQVMCTFDAGGSYLSLPWWVPFRRTVALVLGVALGRCVGALLGYQPFYREWTTDWDAAVEKMGQSVFQRRFADKAKTD
ncbi:hypothetical protein C7999DRAFT_40489 [Corynascus novoguineensis]|uniref:Uncharacterized protein n=1 Tax=Corynascus novoguineensis TaxID=1126955 RepID=A0AAN7CUV3_9PEZI|nr:hypothetical protein C7999DRAFT_40489 [Corynascus novoguineensis]